MSSFFVRGKSMFKIFTDINRRIKYSFSLVILILVLLNIINQYYIVSYDINANILFLLLSVFLYIMFKFDNTYSYFTPYKIYIYTFFIFYVFQIFSTQFSDPYYYDYPYEYKTSLNLLISANLFIISSTMFVIGYKNAQIVKIKKIKSNKVTEYLKEKENFLKYNYILFCITILIDVIVSYIYTGTLFARYTMTFGVKLGSLSLLLFSYPAILSNNFYIFLKYRIGLKHKLILIAITILILVSQFMTGSRSMIFNFVIAAAYLFILFIKSNEKVRSTLNKIKPNKHLIKVVVVILIISIYLINVSIQYIRQGIRISDLSLNNFLWKYDTLEVLMVTIRQFPNIEPFMPFYTLKNILVWPMPRKFYANKSIAFGKYIAYVIWPSYVDIPSAYAGITFGEFYANFGAIGMAISMWLLGIALGLIYRYCYEDTTLNIKSLIYSYILLGLYGFLRGDFTSKLIHLLIPFAMMGIIVSLMIATDKSLHKN